MWERVGKALFGAVPVARVNVQQQTTLANKYGVRFVPDVRIFEHKGMVHGLVIIAAILTELG